MEGDGCVLKGNGVSPGIGFAQALVWHTPVAYDYMARKASQPQLESKRFKHANACLLEKFEQLRLKTVRRFGDAEAAIFEAYKMMLCDEEGLLEPLHNKIHQHNLSAEYAVVQQFGELGAQFLEMDDEYLRQRSEDVFALRDQILRELQGTAPMDASHLDRPTIIVADTISPTDIANLDLSRLEGVICETGAYSSHAAIIARTLGIPAVMGVSGAMEHIQTGDSIALDGESGEIWISPDEATIGVLHLRADTIAERRKQVQLFRGRPTISTDGHRIELSANAGYLEEVDAALAADAESLGLFRTESLHFSSPSTPDEEEQYLVYRKLLEKMGGKAATVRTFDSGKPGVAGMRRKSSTLVEENPVLGYRGIRMSLGRPSFFRTQLRALLRASAYGPLKIVFPMVSNLDELLEAKAALELIKSELDREGIPYDEGIPIGVLIAVPAAALMSEALAPHVDFFSIGINDLLQFTLAVDRGSPQLSPLYHQYHPAILRLIKWTVDAAHSNGIPCNICGEAPGHQRVLPLLLGLGLDGFSFNPSMILPAREVLNNCNYIECKLLADEVLQMQSSSQVTKKLAQLYP